MWGRKCQESGLLNMHMIKILINANFYNIKKINHLKYSQIEAPFLLPMVFKDASEKKRLRR